MRPIFFCICLYMSIRVLIYTFKHIQCIYIYIYIHTHTCLYTSMINFTRLARDEAGSKYVELP